MGSQQKVINKLQQALHGVTVAIPWPKMNKMKAYGRITDPPSYLTEITLSILFESRQPKGEDKSDWSLPINFNGIFQIGEGMHGKYMDLVVILKMQKNSSI